MRKLFQPAVIIPAIFGVSVFAALIAVSNVKKVLAVMSGFPHLFLLYFLLLTAAYEVVRCVQWHNLLTALGLHVAPRTQIFSFAAGEVSKNMPLGNFFQNYLLQRATGTDFGLSSSATLLIVLIQVAVALAGLVILGIGPWDWLRPLIVGGLAAFLLAVWAVRALHRSPHMPAWMTAHAWLRYALAEYRQFRHGADVLLHPRVLASASLLGAVYTLIAGASFYLITRGLGLDAISFGEALAVSLFSLAVGLIVPIPVDIGTLEVSGVAALIALGVGPSDAVAAVIINRVLSIGASSALALLSIVVMPGELRLVIRGRPPVAPLSPARTEWSGSGDCPI
jgi:uncharacterized membrane protein YbhN (UPF0104 family)